MKHEYELDTVSIIYRNGKARIHNCQSTSFWNLNKYIFSAPTMLDKQAVLDLIRHSVPCKRFGKGHRTFAAELYSLMTGLRASVLVDQIVLQVDDVQHILRAISSTVQMVSSFYV